MIGVAADGASIATTEMTGSREKLLGRKLNIFRSNLSKELQISRPMVGKMRVTTAEIMVADRSETAEIRKRHAPKSLRRHRMISPYPSP